MDPRIERLLHDVIDSEMLGADTGAIKAKLSSLIKGGRLDKLETIFNADKLNERAVKKFLATIKAVEIRAVIRIAFIRESRRRARAQPPGPRRKRRPPGQGPGRRRRGRP